jgi:predicted Zn-dependent protease
MKRILPALLIAVSALTLSCSTVPITGRRQLSLVSDREILSSSLAEYRSYMGNAKVSGNKAQAAQVVRVGRRIADATESYLRGNGLGREVANFAWEFNLVQDPEVNAFCMPGGKIVVYTGLMALVSSDDELAVVLGHEVAHAVAKHSNERMSQQLLAAAGAAAATEAVGRVDASKRGAAATVFGLGAQVGVMLPFSRRHESEADYMGLALMTMAGFDPGAAVGFWKKMAAQGGSSMPAILSSHPSDATRIADIQNALPEIRARYGAAK